MDENIVLTENTPPVPPQNNEIKLVDIPIRDENTALNVMVSFLSLSQKRGSFSFDESAKIWECIKMFQK
jgi:hypothetical protein